MKRATFAIRMMQGTEYTPEEKPVDMRPMYYQRGGRRGTRTGRHMTRGYPRMGRSRGRGYPMSAGYEEGEY